MTAKASQNLRVLVVDDNRDAADTLALLVKLKGHEVFVAYDSMGGFRLATAMVPDVVFHDIALPDMNGYEAARRMRADVRCCRTMLVALTGFSAKSDIQRAQEAGFHLHIVKPIEYASILEVLEAAAASAADRACPGHTRRCSST